MSVRFLVAALALLAAAPLAAQQDTGMMAHDTGMMAHDTGMMMSSDSSMMDHGMTMQDEGMAKRSEEYQITQAGKQQRLVLTKDFTAPTGPDLSLLLSSGPTDKGALTLGKLKQPAAGQSFDLPKGKDLGKYTTLVVWSKKEKKAVATADFHAPGAMGH